MNENVKNYVIAPIIGGLLSLGYNSVALQSMGNLMQFYWYLIPLTFLFGFLLVAVANLFATILFNKKVS